MRNQTIKGRSSFHVTSMLILILVLTFPALSESQRIDVSTGFVDPVTGMAFVAIQSGCFQMGCGNWYWAFNCESDEKPVRRICLNPFLIGRYEVTQRQWEVVMGSNPAHAKECGPDCPVESVSWEDVREFITRLNALHKGLYRFRLPTEAEWEYAFRSGGHEELFCGSDESSSVAWYLVTSGNRPHPVGTKQPNGLGLFDMSGNVWEWCADYYGIYASKETLNPKGPSEGSSRVIRGGGWGDHYSRFCRSAFRNEYLPHLKSKFIGFRLVVEQRLKLQSE